MQNDEKFITTAEVAKYLGIAVSTLAMYRMTGVGPDYVKVLNRLVRYRRTDVDNWLNNQAKNNQMPY